MIKKISVLVFLIAVLFLGCERDDICSEATATTPHLIIRFYDVNDTDEPKTVRQLTVTGQGVEDEIVSSTTTDSILLPLRFQNEGETISTFFELKKDTDYDTNGNDSNASNTDVIEVSYTPEFIYVSRACGYKSIFAGTEIDVIEADDDDVWIINALTVNTTIEDEKGAHINIYH
ncbi:hypothetical protein DMZ43_08255 [Meridianimaribacter sp. CL38]|uniref:DUF6452 family protein n=1 Tax=Meridianimaribacter sp. CL38 TaxID=2213021 RepID=UPI00103AA820|nr:DUF6452 family protein [Meridianimaribacter sp. CL38]TBV25892.1 hypothetical protein DMZ43_08255 [Meridianimaribacter sp. CL38]